MARSAEALLGRRHLARVARVLADQARLDTANDMETNGELLVQAVVVRNVGSGPLVAVDVGANRGDWSTHLLDACHEAGTTTDLHVFEPSAFTFGLLADALVNRAPAGVRLVNQGLSDKEGQATLYQSTPGAGSNSLHGIAGTTTGLDEETVQLTSLDRYASQLDLDRIDLLKIDAEGHDLLVLDGARRLLAAQRIGVAQFEYNHRWIGARRYLKDAFDLLEPLGYRVGKVTPRGIELYTGWHPELENFREGNFVALRPDAVAAFPLLTWWNQRNASDHRSGARPTTIEHGADK